MQSWDAPGVPRLPGRGMALRLYDTATGQLRPTAAGATASLYVCGTGAAHLGDAMTYVTFDLVNRVWRDAGHTVRYVLNAHSVGDPPGPVRGDLVELRVIPPSHFVSTAEMSALISADIIRLQDLGATYQLAGDSYFDLATDPFFGSVAGLDRHTMAALFAQRGGDPTRAGKRNPLDPVLCQAAGAPERAPVHGHGRPAPHIACAAIAVHLFAMGCDVLGGGRDLAFPHHEMCASLAQALTGMPRYARHWVHVGKVGLAGAAMTGDNGVLVSALLAQGTPATVVRLALLAHHYRDDWQWTSADLGAAEERLASWRRGLAAGAGPSAHAVLRLVRERLSDDLDAPAALRAIDAWADDAVAGRGRDWEAPALIRAGADGLLGLASI